METSLQKRPPEQELPAITLESFRQHNPDQAEQYTLRSFRGFVRFVITHSDQVRADILTNNETGAVAIAASPEQLVEDIQNIREGYGQAAHIPQYLQTLQRLSRPEGEPEVAPGIGIDDFLQHWGDGAPILFRNFLKRIERGDFPQLAITEQGLTYREHQVQGDIVAAYEQLQELHGTKKYPTPLLRVLKAIASTKVCTKK
jgi:hypothetical protein